MAQTFKTSGAQVIRPAADIPIRIVEYANPEIILPQMIQDYLLEIGFSSLYPNFKHINISAVHPFAIMLFNEVQGQKQDLSVFPSLTVSDSADSEINTQIGHGFENSSMTPSQMATLLGQVDAGYLILSDDNRVIIQAAIDAGATLFYNKASYRAQHTVDLNIWTENKDLTSLIYDLIKHFIIGNINKLHIHGYDMNNPLSGRRSGDINVEFGRLLYGANISLPLAIDTASMMIDVPVEIINSVNLESLYHSQGYTADYPSPTPE